MSRSRYFDLAIVFERDHAGAKKWKSELAANNSDQTTMVDKLPSMVVRDTMGDK